MGKTQEVCTALTFSIEQSLDHDISKAAVLRAYDLKLIVRFQNHQKISSQTFSEFACEKTVINGVQQAELPRLSSYENFYCWRILKVAFGGYCCIN